MTDHDDAQNNDARNNDAQNNDALRPAGDDDIAYDPELQDLVRDTLREWSASLDARPLGVPLESPPAAVWERITAAIATAELAGEHPKHRRLRALPGGRWTTPLVAASVAGLALVVGANVLGSFSIPTDEPAVVAGEDPAAESSSDAAFSRTAVDALADSPQVLQAGFVPPARKVMDLSEELTYANVAEKIDEVLGSVGVEEPQDVLDMPAEDWQPSADGMTSDPQVLRNCVTKVTKVATSQALLVLRANVNGLDAGLVVVPEFMVDMTSMEGMGKDDFRRMGRRMGVTTIYVVEPTCGMEAPDEDPTLMRVSFTLAP